LHAPSAVSLVKGISKYLAIASAGVVSVTAGRLFHLLLSVTSNSALTLTKGVSKTLSVTSAASLSIVKQVAITLRIASFSSVIINALASIFSGINFARKLVNPKVSRAYIVGKAEVAIVAEPTSVAHIIGSVDLTVHEPMEFLAGDSWQIYGPLLDNSDAPIPLAGVSISWKLDSVDEQQNFVTLALGDGITIVDAARAAIQVSVPTGMTEGLSPGSYRDALRITLPIGDQLTMWSGFVIVK
jgi:hypothetical protein